MIRLTHVGFSYGREPVLADVSFELGPGLTLLVGPNGSGKSTLLKTRRGCRTTRVGRRRTGWPEPVDPRDRGAARTCLRIRARRCDALRDDSRRHRPGLPVAVAADAPRDSSIGASRLERREQPVYPAALDGAATTSLLAAAW